LPIHKRKRVPEIEQVCLDIMSNFIGSLKAHSETKYFKDIDVIPLETAYQSTIAFYEPSSLKALIHLLCQIQ
jgi:hypothetical protein